MNGMSTTDGGVEAQITDGAPQDEEAYAYAEADDIQEISPTPSPNRNRSKFNSDEEEDSDSSDDSELDRMFAGGDNGTSNASDAVAVASEDNNEDAVRAAIASKFTVPTATISPTSSATTNNNNNNNNNNTKQFSANWGLVKQAVAVTTTTPKNDLWSAIQEAIGESKEDETHRNDKNDTNSSFTFKNFRRELSLMRRSSTMESENGMGDDSEKSLWSAGSGDGSFEDNNHDDEDDDEHNYEEELPIFAPVTRVGSRFDRKKTLVQSIRRSALTSSTLSSMSGELGSAGITDFLKLTKDEAVKEWARSFYHLDPRWQILTFFNDLALEGTDNLESTGGIINADKKLQIPLMLRVFARAGVFSVWRPTSNEAIRYMMTGEGVGKGLDIKGKSALRGKYSGFVPFMQIHDNEHKTKVCSMTSDSRVRIFYPNQRSRDRALALLKPLRDMMMQKTNDSLKVIEDTEELEAKVLSHAMKKSFKTSKSKKPSLSQMKGVLEKSQRMLRSAPMQAQQQQFEKALEDKADNIMANRGNLVKIDDYPNVYGMEVPEKLFWEAFVKRNDITREEGTEEDTGRPSIPEFQVMNIETLRKPKTQGSSFREPRPVLYHAGCREEQENTNPLCPLGLLMAYEEITDTSGKVTPVVSDFDCFLVGTRGVQFTEPLEESVSSMLTSCVDDIEGILANPEEGTSWTMRWLEVKKKHLRDGQKLQECKRFGYADPKSYRMMTGAVHRLRENGAVRHGPECFNYSFPQELDDKFLVISDSLPGRVPWKYVDGEELRAILSERIDQGYTFPMNPAWILCNPSWKELYDKLLASDRPNVQNAIAVWYPDHVKRKIHEITTKYPAGFVHNRSPSDPKRLSGNSIDLAEMELNRYNVRRRGRNKLKRALDRRRATMSMSGNPTLFSATLMLLRVGKESDEKEKRSQLLRTEKATTFNQSLPRIVDAAGEVEEEAERDYQEEKRLLRRGSKSSGGSKRSAFSKARRASVEKLFKPIKRVLSGRRSSSAGGSKRNNSDFMVSDSSLLDNNEDQERNNKK